MSFEWLSVYECVRCGASGCSTAVTYDRLGYPLCSNCDAARDFSPRAPYN